MEKLQEATLKEINEALSRWDMPEIPDLVTESKADLELLISNWLYELVRRNVKRGRIFHLREVLSYQQADCLGYTKLMTCLGQKFALDMGIVEVVIDNGGRYVPHYVNLIKLSSGKRRFMDLWYGSRDIKHRRLGVQAKEREKWKTRDLDWDELERVRVIRALPSSLVDGITHYILGNRYLERGIHRKSKRALDKAIEHYTTAINLYPGYARAYFNRAVAYENKEEHEKANSDYTQALKDESSQIRVLAREHEDVTALIELDKAKIGTKKQEIYLLRKGFITGEPVASANIARRCHISESEVDAIISAIEARSALL